MIKYVFTTHMKRHERADLCVKLYREMHTNRRVVEQLLAMNKKYMLLKKGINRFKPRKEPLYHIEIIEYKGTVCYLFIDQQGWMQYVFNSSPVDGAFAEFIRVCDAPTLKAVLYSQHALDRYNERVHKGKYTSHRDIIKRFMVNNASKAESVTEDETFKNVARVAEGFLVGIKDQLHHMVIYNTFFDKDEYMDNESQKQARALSDILNSFKPKQFEIYQKLQFQFTTGVITKEEHEKLAILHGVKITIKGLNGD